MEALARQVSKSIIVEGALQFVLDIEHNNRNQHPHALTLLSLLSIPNSRSPKTRVVGSQGLSTAAEN